MMFGVEIESQSEFQSQVRQMTPLISWQSDHVGPAGSWKIQLLEINHSYDCDRFIALVDDTGGLH